MKNLFIILFISTSTWSSTDLVSCFDQAEKFGGINIIDKSCINHAKANKDKIPYIESESGDIRVYGFHKILFIERDILENKKLITKTGIIAGLNSKLKNIVDLDISEDGKKLYVLNQKNDINKEILIFFTNRNGPVKPREIAFPDLKEAKEISLSSKKINFVTDRGISSVNEEASTRTYSENHVAVIDDLAEGGAFKNSKKLASSKDKIVVYNEEEKTITSFNISDMSIDWHHKLKDLKIDSVKSIRYLKKKNSFVIHSGNKKIFLN